MMRILRVFMPGIFLFQLCCMGKILTAASDEVKVDQQPLASDIHETQQSSELPADIPEATDHCPADSKDGDACQKSSDNEAPENNIEKEGEDKYSLPSNFLRRSMEGLEEMFEKSGVREKFGDVMDQVVSSKERMIQGLDNVMDKMSASRMKMMEELDHVIDKVTHSKMYEDIRALPRELRESFVLSVRNRSYIVSGILVAITTAILIIGAIYLAWCHHESWSHGPLHTAWEAAEADVSGVKTTENGTNGHFSNGSAGNGSVHSGAAAGEHSDIDKEAALFAAMCAQVTCSDQDQLDSRSGNKDDANLTGSKEEEVSDLQRHEQNGNVRIPDQSGLRERKTYDREDNSSKSASTDVSSSGAEVGDSAYLSGLNQEGEEDRRKSDKRETDGETGALDLSLSMSAKGDLTFSVSCDGESSETS